MEISEKVFKEILKNTGNGKFETGGILGSEDLKHITHFCYDEYGSSTEASYTPNVEYLNSILEEWSEKHIFFVGIVHSHSDNPVPSCADIAYAKEILASLPHLDEFYIPIVNVKNKEKTLHPFKITRQKTKVVFSAEEYNIY